MDGCRRTEFRGENLDDQAEIFLIEDIFRVRQVQAALKPLHPRSQSPRVAQHSTAIAISLARHTPCPTQGTLHPCRTTPCSVRLLPRVGSLAQHRQHPGAVSLRPLLVLAHVPTTTNIAARRTRNKWTATTMLLVRSESPSLLTSVSPATSSLCVLDANKR